MMTEELKQALKDQNLYSHQAMYGALKLSEWWEMLKAEEDMAVESATDGV